MCRPRVLVCRPCQSTVRVRTKVVADAVSAGAEYATLPDVIREELGTDQCICVSILPMHCANLASALAAFVADAVNESAARWQRTCSGMDQEMIQSCLDDMRALCNEYEPSDLTLINAWYDLAGVPRPQFVLLLPGAERCNMAVLNDLVQSVATWAHGDATMGRIALTIVAVHTPPLPVLPREKTPRSLANTATTLASLLTPRVLGRLDVAPLAFPDKSEFWERVVCQFFIQPRSGIWLGRSIFELVRRRYWHLTPSWDTVAHTVRLCYLEHFRTRPQTAFAYALPDLTALHSHWTPELCALLRVTLFAPYVGTMPVPEQLQPLASSDEALWQMLGNVHADVETCMMQRTLALQAIDALLEMNGLSGVYGTKLGLTACISTALELEPPYTDWNAGRTLTYAHTNTTPSPTQLGSLMEHVASTMTAAQMDALAARLVAQAETEAAEPLSLPAQELVDETRSRLKTLPSAAPLETRRGTFVAWYRDLWMYVSIGETDTARCTKKRCRTWAHRCGRTILLTPFRLPWKAQDGQVCFSRWTHPPICLHLCMLPRAPPLDSGSRTRLAGPSTTQARLKWMRCVHSARSYSRPVCQMYVVFMPSTKTRASLLIWPTGTKRLYRHSRSSHGSTQRTALPTHRRALV